MDKSVEKFIEGKRFAVAGVSRSGSKFGNTVVAELKARGFEVSIVHPEKPVIGGDQAVARVGDLAGKVDGVVVCLPPAQAEKVVREAAQAGIRNVWLQQGAESPEALAAGRELGLNLVSGRCILMYAPPVTSFHRFHRILAGWFGQL